MNPAQARQRARELIHKEWNTGASWRPVIDALGYDPRVGSGRNTTLRWKNAPAQDQLSQGGGKAEPQPQAPAPAAPKKPPIPARTHDSLYTAGMAGIDLNYNNALQDINLERGRTSFDIGYNASGAVDPRNAYSQANLLQKMWRENRSETSINYASRGQLYSGARKSAIADQDFNYQRGSSELQEMARRRYEDLTLAEQRAGAGRTQAVTQLGAEQAQRWLEQEREWYRNYG